MPEYLAPGVYVEEIDTGAKPIEGVSTSTAGMLGVTERGPVNVPIPLTSYGEYTRWFGERLNKVDFSNAGGPHCCLPHAVEGFFTNGGKRAYVTRVLDASAAYANALLFDRGSSNSASTILLRGVAAGTGMAAFPPLLYVLDATNLSKDLWIRIGDGSTAEYRQLDVNADTTASSLTHVPLNFPLSRSHAAGKTVQQLTFATDKTFTLATANDEDTQPGDQTITITGGDADALTALKDHCLKIGTLDEYRFVMNTPNVKPAGTPGTYQADVLLDSGLQMSYAAKTTVTSLTPTPGASAKLSLDVTGGDGMIFLDTISAPFKANTNFISIDPGTVGIQEVRRIGALSQLTLSTNSYQVYPAGSTVELIHLADDARTITSTGSTINLNTVTVNDISLLAVGQKVVVGKKEVATDADPEVMVIQSIESISGSPPTGKITFTTALQRDHQSRPIITLAAKSLTADVNSGATLIALDDRLSLLAGDVLRIDVGDKEELVTIKSIPNRASGGAAPDSGNVLLTQSLLFPHVKGTQVWREGKPTAPATPAQPSSTVINTPMSTNTLLVTDGTGYDLGKGLIRLTTPTGDIFYHAIAANAIGENTTPKKLHLAQVTLRGKHLKYAHGAGSTVVGRTPLLDVRALDPGEWGDRLCISVEDESTGLVSKTFLTTVIDKTHIRLASVAGVEHGTVLELFDAVTNTVVGEPLKVKSIDRTMNYTIELQEDHNHALSLEQQTLAQARITAKNPLGVRSREFRLTVQLLRQPDPAIPSRDEIVIATEVFRNLSMDPRHSRYISKVIGDINGVPRLFDRRPEGESWYIRVSDQETDQAKQEGKRLGPETLVDILPSGRVRPARQALEGGIDSIATLSDDTYIGEDHAEPLLRTGLQTFRNVDEISLVACPGRTSVAMQQALIDHCELMRYRFAVLDGPPPPDDEMADVQTQRQQFDTKYAAMYHPWLLIPDPFPTNLAAIANYAIPPSGHMLGIYARTDIERGVHKAPANEVVRGILGLRRSLNKGEQDILNPYPVNINVIRDFRHDNRGIRVYGGRVITSDSDWKYVNVRRLLIFIENSIDRGLQWVVFEPNAEPLWARVSRAISSFLTVVWRNGALEGTKPEEAFFVKCDRTTMTQTDIDNGRLICVIGVAPVKPAEFVIIRIGLWTAHATT